MNFLEQVALEQPLFTFSRMLVFVIIGLATFYFDSRLMERKGLERESFWSKVFGALLVLIGIGGWIIFKILG
jgi:hypothetical protein